MNLIFMQKKYFINEQQFLSDKNVKNGIHNFLTFAQIIVYFR